MSLYNSILDYFSKKDKGEALKTPDGVCPNCWGTQDYDGQFREIFKDKQVDVNNHEENYAFIQDFIVNHVDGIRLKIDGSGFKCPTCRVKS
ncbi:hypothetical protein [Flagellimonas onchidii]|uniref:hypothetical protein n=1 Tax=Flagellimonas onchidii TaxID=2562684 RepID=UPI0010A618CC|nr:hypothetical protein [Allomuricauda onchidii]